MTHLRVGCFLCNDGHSESPYIVFRSLIIQTCDTSWLKFELTSYV